MDTSTPIESSFESSIEVYNWLSRFINFEKNLSISDAQRVFRLDRMKTLSAKAGMIL